MRQLGSQGTFIGINFQIFSSSRFILKTFLDIGADADLKRDSVSVRSEAYPLLAFFRPILQANKLPKQKKQQLKFTGHKSMALNIPEQPKVRLRIRRLQALEHVSASYFPWQISIRGTNTHAIWLLIPMFLAYLDHMW